MKRTWIFFVLSGLFLSGFAFSEGKTDVLSESVSGKFMGKNFYWDWHANLGSKLAVAVEPETGAKYLSAAGIKSGPSEIRFNFRDETADLSSCVYMHFLARMKGVTDFRVSFNAKAGVDDASLLFPAFTHVLGRRDDNKWFTFWVPLNTGKLGLIYLQALAKKGLKEGDMKPENFAAVMKYLNRIDFTFYGEEGKTLDIKDFYFTTEGPDLKKTIEEIMGKGVEIAGMDDLLKSGRMMLSKSSDGTDIFKTNMGKNTSFDLEIARDETKKDVSGVLLLEFYDETTNHWERQSIDISALSGGNYLKTDNFFLNGRKGAGSHFLESVWRERPAFITGETLAGVRGPNINLRITSNTDFSFGKVEFVTVDKKNIESLMSRWMENCKKFSMEQMEKVVALAILEDELRQYERGMFYLKKDGDVKELRKIHGEIIDANEHVERLIDDHYFRSPVYFVRGGMKDYEKLTDDIRASAADMADRTGKLRAAVDKSARENGFTVNLKRDFRNIGISREKGVPLLERTVFLMFANSRWGDEGLRDGPGGGILYDAMRLCGMEGRFALTNTPEFSLLQRQDDEKHGWETVPGLWNMHQGINHSLRHSPKLKELYEKYGEEILAQTPAGPADMEVSMYKQWQFPGNIFHPAYRKYIEEYAYDAAKLYARDPGVIALTTVNESNFWAKSKDYDQLASAGYGSLGKEEWHKYLERKYGNISRVNELWGTDYREFKEIPQAPCSRMEPDRKPSGLVYDFEIFRKESFAEFISMMNKSIKAAAPDKLTWAEPWNKFNANPYHGIDYLKLFGSPYLDIVHTHHNATFFTAAYNHMFKRYLGKTIAEGEFTYLSPENNNPVSPGETLYNAGMRNIWNTLSWDMRGIVFWATYFYSISSGGYGGSCHDRNFILPVRAAGAARVMKEKAERINDILFNTDIVSGGVAVMQPYATLILDKMSFYPENVCGSEAESVFNVLSNHGITSFIVPEEYIVDGKESLKEFGVLIIPHATYTDDRLDERLLKWMEDGGTVISVGPYGLYNQYARENRRFLKRLLGDVQIRLAGKEAAKVETPAESESGLPIPAETSIAGWSYSINLDKNFPGKVKVLLALDSGPGIIEVPCGKGRFIMTSFSLGKNLAGKGGELAGFVVNEVLKGIKNRIGYIPARLSGGVDIGLVLRDNGKGVKYVIAVNQSSENYSNCVIEVGGVPARKVVDVTTGEGMSVPFSVKDGKTVFKTTVAPGEGVVFKIEK